MSTPASTATSHALLVGVAALVLGGCTAYRAQPLSHEAVAAALAPPDAPELRQRCSDLHHPRLPALAIDPDADQDPDQLALIAVLVNPGLRALRAERATAQAALVQAGILPNPQLSLGTDLAVRSPDGAATRGNSVGLGWEISTLVTRGARVAAASAHAEAVDLDLAWQEWQVAAGARQAAVRLAGATQRLALAEDADTAAAAQLAAVRRAGEAGLSTGLEATTAASASSDAHGAVLDLRQECAGQRLQLARILGLPAEHRLAVRMPAWPTVLAIPTGLVAALEEQRLDLIALRRGYASQEEAVRAAVLGQFPRISVGLTRARDTSAVTALNLGVTIDLPIFDRNQGAIASETATRQRLFDEYVQRLFEAQNDLAAACGEATATATRIAHLDQAVGDAGAAAAAAAAALADGQLDVVTAHGLAVQAWQRRGEAIAARQHLAELRIAIELTAGRLLPDLVAPAFPTRTEQP